MTHPWLFISGLALLALLVSAGVWRTGQLLRQWTPPFNPLLSPPDNALRLGMIGLCIGLGAAWGPGPAVLGWRTSHLARDLGVGLLAGLALAGFLLWAGQRMVRRWGPEIHNDRLLRCILPASRAEWAPVVLALLPAAALEELLFRSLPLGGLAGFIAPGWLLWPLALFFGLLHWPQGGWGVIGATLAAIAFSLLFLATRSIWAPLSAHYAMNIIQLVLAKRSGVLPVRRNEPSTTSTS